MLRRRQRSVSLPFLWLLAAPLSAQLDLQQTAAKQQAAEHRVEALQKAGLAAVAVLRQAIADPENKVQGDMDEVANKLGGLEFAAALGTTGLVPEHFEYLAEAVRPAVRAELEKLNALLREGLQSQLQAEALRELGERFADLEQRIAGQADLGIPLLDLDASAAKAARSAALDRADLARLRQQLARHRATYEAQVGKDLLERAKVEFAEFETALPELRAAIGGEDAGARDSAFARCDETIASLRRTLARLPAADATRRDLWQKLQAIDAPNTARYREVMGRAVHERMLGLWDGFSHEYEAWAEEEGSTNATDYVNLDGSHFATFGLPRRAALVNRADLWLAFAGTDPEVQRAHDHPAVAKLTAQIAEHRGKALERLVAAATALVDGVVALTIEEDRVRDRLLVLADWDLRLVLHEHAAMWPLVQRVHAVVDAYDQKALGDQAQARRHADGLAAAEANWTRMLQLTAITQGFEPALAAVYEGRLVQVLQVRDRTAEFEAPGADLVFDQGGVVFTATFTEPVRSWLAAERARCGVPAGAGDDYELLAVVGAEATTTLRGPQGKDDGLVVPCRRLSVVGLRTGPVAFVVR